MEEMSSRKPSRPCASECGNAASPASRYCPDCSRKAERNRKERWRKRNPTFKEMVEMSEEDLAETGRRLLQLRAERKLEAGGR